MERLSKQSRRSRSKGFSFTGTAVDKLFWTLAVTALLFTDVTDGFHHNELEVVIPPRIAKRVVEFSPRWVTECPEFPNRLVLLPHPTDCVKFFYCVYGRPVLYVCPPPLHFSPLLNVCDWPSRAGCTIKPTKKPCKLRTTTPRPVTKDEDEFYTFTTDLATIEGSGL